MSKLITKQGISTKIKQSISTGNDAGVTTNNRLKLKVSTAKKGFNSPAQETKENARGKDETKKQA